MDSQAELDIKLCNAASKGNTAKVIELLQKGANIEGNIKSRNIFARTPLMHACALGHLNTVVTLVQHGANLELKCYRTGDTPLNFAFNNKHMSIVKFLLHNNVRTNQYNLVFNRQQYVTSSWAYERNLQEILYLILNAMPDDEVIKAADNSKDKNLITIKHEIEKNKDMLTKILYFKQGYLEEKLCSDITNHTTQLLAKLTAQSFSKEYISSCLKIHIKLILKQYFLDQKNKKQDNIITFELNAPDATSTEPSQKTYTDMIYEGFTAVKNVFFSLFNHKRKREDNNEEHQAEQNHPNKKRRLN